MAWWLAEAGPWIQVGSNTHWICPRALGRNLAFLKLSTLPDIMTAGAPGIGAIRIYTYFTHGETGREGKVSGSEATTPK